MNMIMHHWCAWLGQNVAFARYVISCGHTASDACYLRYIEWYKLGSIPVIRGRMCMQVILCSMPVIRGRMVHMLWACLLSKVEKAGICIVSKSQGRYHHRYNAEGVFAAIAMHDLHIVPHSQVTGPPVT